MESIPRLFDWFCGSGLRQAIDDGGQLLAVIHVREVGDGHIRIHAPVNVVEGAVLEAGQLLRRGHLIDRAAGGAHAVHQAAAAAGGVAQRRGRVIGFENGGNQVAAGEAGGGDQAEDPLSGKRILLVKFPVQVYVRPVYRGVLGAR